MTPSTLVTYTSPTSVLFEWTYSGIPPAIDYNCVVYYQSGKVTQNVSFDVKGGKSGYNLTDLPVEIVDNVSLVTTLAAVYDNPVRPTAYLPSAVIGPVTPSVLTTSTVLLYILLISVFHSCSRVSRGGGVRRRIRSDWDLIHTDMQSHSTYWSTRSLSQHPVEET